MKTLIIATALFLSATAYYLNSSLKSPAYEVKTLSSLLKKQNLLIINMHEQMSIFSKTKNQVHLHEASSLKEKLENINLVIIHEDTYLKSKHMCLFIPLNVTAYNYQQKYM